MTALPKRINDLSNFNQSDTLLIAIGNTARRDDGLGWLFLDQIMELDCFQGKTTYCYQLQVEDAALIEQHPRIIFVDATEEKLNNGFEWEKVKPKNDFTFTTHALTPEAVLYLCQELYKKNPLAYTLKIQGFKWKLKTGLSKKATKNLKKALKYFRKNFKPKSNLNSLKVKLSR